MKRFVQGTDRTQGILLPEQLEDYVSEDPIYFCSITAKAVHLM
jgi:hypothetical protein